MKILILGDTGLVGKALTDHFKKAHQVIGLSRRYLETDYEHLQFDLESESILPILEEKKPDCIISCSRGAFEDQLKCHEDMVAFAKKHDTTVCFYSTANVFDGSGDAVKYETSERFAHSDYGHYKISVEEMVESLDKGIIIRLPMVFAKQSPRMEILQMARRESETLETPDPVYLTAILTEQIVEMQAYVFDNNLHGIFHFASTDVILMKDLYTRILGDDTLVMIDEIEPTYLAIVPQRQDMPFDFKMDDIINRLKL